MKNVNSGIMTFLLKYRYGCCCCHCRLICYNHNNDNNKMKPGIFVAFPQPHNVKPDGSNHNTIFVNVENQYFFFGQISYRFQRFQFCSRLKIVSIFTMVGVYLCQWSPWWWWWCKNKFSERKKNVNWPRKKDLWWFLVIFP